MEAKTVKEIENAFNSVTIPAEFRQHYESEIKTLRRQQERHGGILVKNNQVYASLGNLRKLYRICTKK